MQAALLRGSAFSSRIAAVPVRRPVQVLAPMRPTTVVAPSFVGGEHVSNVHWQVVCIRLDFGVCWAASGVGGAGAGLAARDGQAWYHVRSAKSRSRASVSAFQ